MILETIFDFFDIIINFIYSLLIYNTYVVYSINIYMLYLISFMLF